LTVAVLRALRTACRLPLTNLELAMVAHRAETGIVGAPVGVMDQIAVSLGDAAHALFIDTRRLSIDPIPWPSSARLLIVHSGVTHDHSRGDYRTRRAECDEAARRLGVALLSDVREDDLARVSALPSPLDRRVRHVVTENRRVLAAVAAMRAGDLETLGRLWLESHASQRDDFETSLPVIDAIVEGVSQVPGVHGARLTGGGIGGAVIVLSTASSAETVAQTIRSDSHFPRHGPPRVLWPI
jgi:galactokinase